MRALCQLSSSDTRPIFKPSNLGTRMWGLEPACDDDGSWTEGEPTSIWWWWCWVFLSSELLPVMAFLSFTCSLKRTCKIKSSTLQCSIGKKKMESQTTWTTTRRGRRSFWAACKHASSESRWQSITRQSFFLSCSVIVGCIWQTLQLIITRSAKNKKTRSKQPGKQMFVFSCTYSVE